MITAEDSISIIVQETLIPSPRSDPSSPLTDEITYNRKSTRNSFQHFIDSRLNDILEFEDETVRRSSIKESKDNEFDSMNGTFVAKILASSLGPANILSNGSTDIENYSLKIPVKGGSLKCLISSSLVSAMVSFHIKYHFSSLIDLSINV